MRAGIVLCCVAAAIYTAGARAATEDLGNGFYHHGIATPVSNHRGIVATTDANNRDVVLVWLFDHRGGYALLLIDAETGKSEQFPVPFPPGGDCPYASILSSKNKFYTHFNSYFVEFDPAKRAFTFCQATAPQMAMGMTEDDQGVIWSVTYPQSRVVAFDPATAALRDYGHVYKQNWAQYQRSVAADDAGWIYFGIGSTASQIIAFDPRAAEARPVVPEGERVHGAGTVYRDKNGKVYGNSGNTWYELYQGAWQTLPQPPVIDKKAIITDSQGLFHAQFPDGKVLRACDLVDRMMSVEDPQTGDVRTVPFEYTSEGAHIMGIAVAPDGTLCGGTAFPMRFFSYNPKTGAWVNRASYGQWNTVARQGDRFFAGGYGGGFLLEWDPARPWVDTDKGNANANPLFLTECTPTIHRPHDLLACPDGTTLVLAGTPGYGFTGGGLLFWERETRTQTLLEHTSIIPDQAIESLAPLPEGKILCGTTISPGTGGETKAATAELCVMDLAAKRLEWHAPVLAAAREYTDLCTAPNGLVYGVADCSRFFVFDAARREVLLERNLTETLGSTNHQQGPRVFVLSPEGVLYLLLANGIARVDQATHEITLLAKSPVPVGPGGDFLDGRVYFGSGAHLYSYAVP